MGDNFHAQGLWETPDTMQTLLHYPDKEVQAYFEGTFVNAHPGAMTEFMGTEATLYIDRGRYEVHPEPKRNSIGELMENPLRPSELILGSGPRGQDFYDRPNGEILHLSNWLECIRTRQCPNAPVEAGVKAAAAAHLGNIAYRKGQVERLNSEPQGMPSAATTSPPCVAQPFELPGQHLTAGLFDLREMDLHLHAGLERQVPLNAWIDFAVADGRKVLVLLDHLELYRKTPQQYEAWRSGRDFQADYPLGPAGHKALFADFDAAAKRQDVIVFKGWEIGEDELDGRLEAAPMRMAEVIGWHISPKNGAEPPNGRTLIHRVKQIGEVQKQYPVPMMVFHPFPMRIENIRNTAQARGRDLRTITPEEYRFFQPGEQEELIKLLSGSSIYIEISHGTEPCFKDPACREALIADTLPLAKAGVQFSISTDNHYMGHLKKPFNPAYYCAPMGITPFNSNTIVRELLALKAKREMLAAQEHGSRR
jgi:histidinol phosphatase-like PHP family hydrolase